MGAKLNLRDICTYLYRKFRQKCVILHEFIVMKENSQDIIQTLESREYQYGFTTDIETETLPKGLNEGIVRAISERKGEPEWMTECANVGTSKHPANRFSGYHLLRRAKAEEKARLDG